MVLVRLLFMVTFMYLVMPVNGVIRRFRLRKDALAYARRCKHQTSHLRVYVYKHVETL